MKIIKPKSAKTFYSRVLLPTNLQEGVTKRMLSKTLGFKLVEPCDHDKELMWCVLPRGWKVSNERKDLFQITYLLNEQNNRRVELRYSVGVTGGKPLYWMRLVERYRFSCIQRENFNDQLGISEFYNRITVEDMDTGELMWDIDTNKIPTSITPSYIEDLHEEWGKTFPAMTHSGISDAMENMFDIVAAHKYNLHFS